MTHLQLAGYSYLENVCDPFELYNSFLMQIVKDAATRLVETSGKENGFIFMVVRGISGKLGMGRWEN